VLDYADAIAAVKAMGLKPEAEELLLSGAARKVFTKLPA